MRAVQARAVRGRRGEHGGQGGEEGRGGGGRGEAVRAPPQPFARKRPTHPAAKGLARGALLALCARAGQLQKDVLGRHLGERGVLCRVERRAKLEQALAPQPHRLRLARAHRHHAELARDLLHLALLIVPVRDLRLDGGLGAAKGGDGLKLLRGGRQRRGSGSGARRAARAALARASSRQEQVVAPRAL